MHPARPKSGHRGRKLTARPDGGIVFFSRKRKPVLKEPIISLAYSSLNRYSFVRKYIFPDWIFYLSEINIVFFIKLY